MLRQDVAVVGSRARRRFASGRQVLPYYVPRPAAVGGQLGVASALSELAGSSSSIEAHEVLPARTVIDGAGRSIRLDPVHAFAVEPARLLTIRNRLDGVIVDGRTILSEISTDYRASPGGWKSFHRLQRWPAERHVRSAVSLVSGRGGEVNYAHWLYDVLPKVHLLRRAGVIRGGETFVVPRLDREYKVATLARLGIAATECVQVEGPLMVATHRLAVSSGHRSHHRVEAWTARFIREALLLDEIPQTGLRLYISRRDTNVRRVFNEGALEAALAARGFTAVTLAGRTFDEQVQLFASAEMVVAAHGAGLANVAFCAPGARILEVRGDAHFQPWFEDISNALGLSYTSIDASRNVGSSILPGIIRHQELVIDRVLDAVDAVLR